MAFDAYFFNFQKKENSTLTPTQAQWEAGADLKINLLEETSIINPTFRLEFSTPPHAVATNYNYCYVPDFHRFYFIDDWKSYRGLWICNCRCDVLASYKATIIASSQYVVRSASNYDLSILDTLYPTKTQPTASMNSAEEGAIYSMTAGALDLCVTLQTMGSLNDSFHDYYPPKTTSGGLLYACSLRQLKEILMYITSDLTDWLEPAADLTLEASKVIFNPFDYFRAVRIYPLNNIYSVPVDPQTEQPVPPEPVKFGFWETDSSVTAYRVNTGIFQTSFHIPLNSHPQAATRGNKMNGAPYTQRVLHFEPFGTINIDTSLLVACIGLYIHLIIDLNTGSAKYEIKGYADSTEHDTPFSALQRPIVSEGHAQMGYEIPLLEMKQNVNFGNVLPTVGKMAAYSVSSIVDFFKTGEFSPPSGIGDALTAMTTEANVKGGGGTMLPCVNSRPFVVSYYVHQVDENIIDHGRPLCQIRALNGLSGYCLCENAELTINGTATEQQQIISMLNSGVFLE